jgi:hypothetical protein
MTLLKLIAGKMAVRLKLAVVVNALVKSKPKHHPEETITARHVWLWIDFVPVT